MNKSIILHTILALAFGSTLVFAGAKEEKNVQPAPAEPAEKNWWFISATNSWVTAIDGEVGWRGMTVSADTSMSEVLDSLDLAYMTHFEFGYKRWSIGLDGVYAKLSDGASYEYGPIHGSMEMELEQAFVTARLQYRLVENEALTLDIFAGARWTYISTEVDVHTSLSFDRPALQRFNRERSRHFDFSEDWFDPIVGLRGVFNLGKACFVQLSGDIGGFGVESDLNWQAFGGIGYRFSPRISSLLGYRALGIDYEKENLKLDIVSHGPTVALMFKF